MSNPGEKAGDCPRCGGERVLIGHDTVTIGAYCDRCELTVVLKGDAVEMPEAREWAKWRDEHEHPA